MNVVGCGLGVLVNAGGVVNHGQNRSSFLTATGVHLTNVMALFDQHIPCIRLLPSCCYINDPQSLQKLPACSSGTLSTNEKSPIPHARNHLPPPAAKPSRSTRRGTPTSSSRCAMASLSRLCTSASNWPSGKSATRLPWPRRR